MKSKKQEMVPKINEATTAKACFNIAVQTLRPQLVPMIKEPIHLTIDEARALATDLIELKLEANSWKEKWMARKELCDDWLNAAIEATNTLKTITMNRAKERDGQS